MMARTDAARAARRRYPRDAEGLAEWERLGMNFSTWRDRQHGALPRAEYEAWVAVSHPKHRTVGGDVPPTVAVSGRRGWCTAITDTFGGSWSTVQKLKAELEKVLGCEIPSYVDRGSDFERAMLLQYALSFAKNDARPLPTDPLSGLSVSQQAKLEAFKRAFVKQQEREYLQRVHAAAQAMFDEKLLARFEEREKAARQLDEAWRGIFSKAEYQLLLKLLHPDSNCDPEQYNEGFRLVRKEEQRLLKKEERRAIFPPGVPTTFQELMARKAKLDAERKAKRAAQKEARDGKV